MEARMSREMKISDSKRCRLLLNTVNYERITTMMTRKMSRMKWVGCSPTRPFSPPSFLFCFGSLIYIFILSEWPGFVTKRRNAVFIDWDYFHECRHHQGFEITGKLFTMSIPLPLFSFSLLHVYLSLQQLASLSLVELCKATSGEYGCATAAPGEISVLLNSLESPAASLRFATLQGLLVLTYLLSTRDHGTSQTARLVRRLWVAKFDVDEENAKLAERYSFDSSFVDVFLGIGLFIRCYFMLF